MSNSKPHKDDRERHGARRDQAPLHPFAADDLEGQDGEKEVPPQPQSHGEDRIEAFPRSPSSLLVYWELSGPVGSALMEREGRWVLELTELDTGVKSEVAVEPASRRRYLSVKAGGCYVVRMGLRAEGEFHPACSTREARMPGAAPSAAGQVKWTRAQGTEPGPAAARDPRSAGRRPARGKGAPGLRFDPKQIKGGSSSRGPRRRKPSR